jgi:hypothetical protein
MDKITNIQCCFRELEYEALGKVSGRKMDTVVGQVSGKGEGRN